MQQRKALGKGLASLIPTIVPRPSIPTASDEPQSGMTVPIDAIVPNRHQPRQTFHEERLQELADSIRAQGIIQPIIVRPTMNDRYEIIAGERRWRAAKLAGLIQVPVYIRQIEEEGMLELAIIENVQREDLNAIEEAKGYQALMEQFDYRQEEVGQKVGKSRTAVANSVRLLQLPKVIQEDVVQGRMSASHARPLLGILDLQEQLTLRERILQMQLSVRDVERMVQERRGAERPQRKSRHPLLTPQLKHLVEEMTNQLGTKVHLRPKNDKAGSCVIEYYSLQDLDRIYRRLVQS